MEMSGNVGSEADSSAISTVDMQHARKSKGARLSACNAGDPGVQAVGEYLQIEPVTEHIIRCNTDGKNFLSHDRLVNIFNKFSGQGFIISYGKIKTEKLYRGKL